MKQLLLKTFFMVLFVLATIALTVMVVETDADRIFNNTLESKIAVLLTNNDDCKLIFAGDSRAERGIIPGVVSSKYGVKSANIAVPNGDLVTVYHALAKYGLLEKPVTVVISASFFQVNDGAIDNGYVSLAQVVDMPADDEVRLFYPRLNDAYSLYLVGIKSKIQNKMRQLTHRHVDVDQNYLGFHGIDGKLETSIKYSTDPGTTKHSWYKNISIHGARWRVVKNTLARMSRSRCRFILFQPPVSELFMHHVAHTPIEASENEYSDMLAHEVKLYKNMFFADYWSGSVPGISDDDFYDPQHLNRNGAEKFTSYLINDCIDRGYLHF